MSAIGGALIAVLLALAALHLYWGVGGRWPGQDENSLRLIVAGVKTGPMYGFWACAAVAGALSAAAATVWMRHGPMMSGSFAWIVFAGYVALILVFGLRGLGAYVTPVFEYARGTPFFELNRLYYAPLCLLIAAALAVNSPFIRS